MNYLEFLDVITADSIKKKSSYSIGDEKWHIGRIDGGSDGAFDPHLSALIYLVPKGQKPSVGPRYALRINLTKEDRKVLKTASDPVMLSIERNSAAKYGCKAEHGYEKSWDCQSRIQGKLCNVGDDFLEALSGLGVLNLKEKLIEIGDEMYAAQPFADDFKPLDHQSLSLNNINEI